MGKTKAKAKRPHYTKRSDVDKIESQWTKLTAQHGRTDWSAAVVRAATAAELSVNFAVRKEFADRSEFTLTFVDNLLQHANGLKGKIDRLLRPLWKGTAKLAKLKQIEPLATKINKKRNEIVHSGHFCSEREANELVEDCKNFVQGIVQLYDADFALKEKQKTSKRLKSVEAART